MKLTADSVNQVGLPGTHSYRSQTVEFYHPQVGRLEVYTGLDQVSWGYGLNTQRYPTYGGEVVQILSAYVDDLEVAGTLRSYADMEMLYTYFFTYIQRAAGGGERNEIPMNFKYAHRGWDFEIIPTAAPGYRKATELTVPEWRIQAHVVDHRGDVDTLKALIVEEADLAKFTGENFGLEGKVRYVDENPFSDPWTDHGTAYDPNAAADELASFYSKIIPSYLSGDFDTVFGGLGSKPAFTPEVGAKGTIDRDDYARLQARTAAGIPALKVGL